MDNELLKATVNQRKFNSSMRSFFSQTNRKRSPERTRGGMAACGCFIPELNLESYTPVGESTRGPGTDDLTVTPQQPKFQARGGVHRGRESQVLGQGPVIIGTRRTHGLPPLGRGRVLTSGIPLKLGSYWCSYLEPLKSTQCHDSLNPQGAGRVCKKETLPSLWSTFGEVFPWGTTRDELGQ